ncbi:MAG: 4Fe-4S binding protein [Syntrophomonadaceae bacterium]|nr:4Fe-4S binding protein [Syntrophomonadaceae bacterium]
MAIMIPNIISNLTHGPRTRIYPLEVRKLPTGARGHIEFDMEKCIFCSLCMKRCPADAIIVDRKGKTLTFAPLRCIVCEACIEGCAKDAITLYEQWRPPVTEIPQS